MKLKLLPSVFLTALCSMVAGVCVAASAVGAVPAGVLLFDNGDDGSMYYRIPAICTARDGSIVVAADKRWNSTQDLPNSIDVVVRRSADGGKTWSRATVIAGADTEVGHGDPALVVDRNSGDILCIMTAGNGLAQSTREDFAHVMVCRSQDNGVTWTEPVDISSQLYAGASAPLQHAITAFASSGHALQLADGRLMFVLVVRPESNVWRLEDWAVYSDDGGYTWQVSDCAADLYGDEAKVAQLTDGRLLMSIRNRDKGPRKFAVSHDRGATWGELRMQYDLIEPACNGDMISYNYKGRDILLHSLPNDARDRRNVSILASMDGGRSWPIVRTLVAGNSSYSSLTVLPDGDIGAFVEVASPHPAGGQQLWFYRLTPDWIFGSDFK